MSPTANMYRGGAAEHRRLWDLLPVAVTLACATLLSFLSGGYILTRSAPVAISYLTLAALWIWFLRRQFWPSPWLLAALVAFAAFTVWAGLSILWSFGPDLSWVAFDLAAFYLAVLATVSLTPVRRPGLWVAGWGFLVLATAVAVYAFLGKGLPDVVRTAYTYARLDSPIGYWNVLALLMVLGIAVVLGVAGDRRRHPAARALAAAAGVPMAFTFFFTFSRGGWIALAVVLVVYFALTTTRLASLATLAAVVGPVALVLWHLRGLRTLFTATTDAALRTSQGHVLLRWALATVLVTGLVQAGLALAQRMVPWPRWSRVVAGAAIVLLLVAGTAGVSWRYVEPRGGVSWIKERVRVALNDSDTRAASDAPGRLISLNTGRPPLWREAVRQWRYDRVAGTGAGTFPFTNYRFRQTAAVVKHAHSEWFNVLSELGVVGLVLFVAAVALLVAACVGNPFAHRRDPMQPLLVALQAGVIAFFVHISWDWDWDMAAIGTVVFLFIALAASYQATRAADARALTREARAPGDAAGGHAADGDAPQAGAGEGPATSSGSPAPAAAPWRWPVRAAASAALVLLAVSWALPYLSARSEDTAVLEAGRQRPAAALAAARRSASLDPLAATPLLTQAAALQQLGRDGEALVVLREAQKLQPENYEVYYQEGMLQLTAFDRRRAALAAFRQALQLNPLDGATRGEVAALLGS